VPRFPSHKPALPLLNTYTVSGELEAVLRRHGLGADLLQVVRRRDELHIRIRAVRREGEK
jgi:hypothetical protein